MSTPSAGDVIRPEALELEALTEQLGEHQAALAQGVARLQAAEDRVQAVEQALAELREALDSDGDGTPDYRAAAPRLRALVVCALGALALGGYALTPPEGRDPQLLYLLLGALGALGVGEAALVARALGQRGG